MCPFPPDGVAQERAESPSGTIRDTDVFMHSRWWFHGEVRYMAARHQLARTANHLVNARLVNVDVDGQTILTARGRRLLATWSETREVV